ATALMENRESLVRWIDLYMNALYDLREMLASEDEAGVEGVLSETHAARLDWLTPEGNEADSRLRAELQQSITDSRPAQALMGTYLTEKIFRKRERGDR